MTAPDPAPAPSLAPTHNLPELSVSDLSALVRRTVEEAFPRVRLRGEISQPKVAASGHCYLRMKDDTAVIDAIIWRGTLARLGLRPEEGLEVVAEGRVTTYPGRSSYQFIIESLDLAGEGALLKLLEERRRRLAAEGLFDPDRKRRLPFLPRVVGVVTSPTGAVIRDILHRLADRFPCRVLLWPVAVQGDEAAAQVAAAIAGFNALPLSPLPVTPGGAIPRSQAGLGAFVPEQNLPRPDVLIVARGGGSLEDLMAFNDEAVVRAVAASAIPVVAAIGHETDVTLIDHAADVRAPTPTGAAELVVPVRLDLLAQTADLARRLAGAPPRLLADRAARLEGMGRGLPDMNRLLGDATQRLDDRAERLAAAPLRILDHRTQGLIQTAARLRTPADLVSRKTRDLGHLSHALTLATGHALAEAGRTLAGVSDRLDPQRARAVIDRAAQAVPPAAERLTRAAMLLLDRREERLEGWNHRLESLSYRAVLRRGYAVVRGETGRVVTTAAGVTPGARLTVDFHDGRLGVQAVGEAPPDLPPRQARDSAGAGSSRGHGEGGGRKPKAGDGRQGDLLDGL